MSEESKKKISDSMKLRRKIQPSWNKGLTKDSDDRVAKYSERMIENNPMKRPEVRAKITGDLSSTKRPEQRKKRSILMKRLYKEHPEKFVFVQPDFILSHIGDLNPAKRPEVRLKISQNNPMKQPEMRIMASKRFLENNPMSDPLVRSKISGSNNYNWKDGISYEPYCPLFNKNLKMRIRAFFNYQCILCGKSTKENAQSLSCHHISYNKNDCCENKLVQFAALCNSCHSKTNFDRERWENILHTIINEVYNGRSYYTKEEWNKIKKEVNK